MAGAQTEVEPSVDGIVPVFTSDGIHHDSAAAAFGSPLPDTEFIGEAAP